MSERYTAPVPKVLLVMGLVAVGILATAACTKEVIKEVPVEVTREVPVEVIKEVPKEVIVEKEVPMTLSALAQAIREGKIDVGEGYGLVFGNRYHTIHAINLGLECAACHIVGTLDATQAVFNAQDVSPQAPGPVDRRACLGCHSAGGPATELYDSGG